jgi:pimeloyl-ACP methyl ester carboxylesterase
MTQNAKPQADDILTIDRFVPHVSTVPANAGKLVGLHLRERVLASRLGGAGGKPAGVVLFVHGGFLPGVLAYDLPFKDYSAAATFARAGHDCFVLTLTGYGSSPKPMMDDPCNVDAQFQHLLIPHVLKQPTPPRYPFKLVSSRTEFDEIETAVAFIRDLRKVDRLSVYGWSTGAPRVGGFAALHPDLVDKVILVCPAPFFPNDNPPAAIPEPGAPTLLQTREFLFEERWQADVKAEGQLEHAEIRDVLWDGLMTEDGLGAEWAANGRGIMRAPNRMNYGWRENTAKIKAPTLIMLGEFDNYQKRRDSWHGLKSTNHKVFVRIAAGSHFTMFEYSRRALHRHGLEWLESGTVGGSTLGEFHSDRYGALSPLEATRTVAAQ